MRILLVGEYSRLHNSLKEGLISLGHEVILVGTGDGFKNYPTDYSIDCKWSKSKIINIPRQIIYRLFNYDFGHIEHGIRFYFLLKKLRDFDVVQFINEKPIKTIPWLELFLIKKLIQHNKNLFLLSAGVDYNNVKFLTEKKLKYSILTPYFENKKHKKKYQYVFDYLKPGNKKIHDFVYDNSRGIIASDIDYVLPLLKDPKFLGLIPNPVNLSRLSFSGNTPNSKIVIFLGINLSNYIQKGMVYFEKALDIIQKKYPDKVEILKTTNLPYKEYINAYNRCNILMDQVFGYDQGYNALEAMAKGKVVFTGAEQEFVEYYKLTERVNINALPDVDYLVDELSYLIENPAEIQKIGSNARTFMEKEHDHIKIAEKYMKVWKTNSLSI